MTSLTDSFADAIMLPANRASAFSLTRESDSVALTLEAATVDARIVVMSFAGGATEVESRADGRYTLAVLASQVNSRRFDGNGDGTPGDDWQLAGSPTNGLFRLFGDANGDGVVNAQDFGQFRPAFGTSVGQAAYLAFLEPNGEARDPRPTPGDCRRQDPQCRAPQPRTSSLYHLTT